jgi:hypothetical protein
VAQAEVPHEADKLTAAPPSSGEWEYAEDAKPAPPLELTAPAVSGEAADRVEAFDPVEADLLAERNAPADAPAPAAVAAATRERTQEKQEADRELTNRTARQPVKHHDNVGYEVAGPHAEAASQPASRQQATSRVLAGASARKLEELLEDVPADAMVITIRRRLPDVKLNELQRSNLDLLERQLLERQTPKTAPQTAPAAE